MERDPTGKGQHEPGAKVDEGKLLPHLVLGEFALALTEVTKVGTFGAKKYTPRGWLEVPNAIERYQEAAFRHKMQALAGEEVDDQSGFLHLAHEAWNLLAILELKLRGIHG